MRIILLTIAAWCFYASAIYAQQIYKLEKWGKVPEEDLKMTQCSFDSNASSMSLLEVGSYELTYTREGWRVLVNYRNRIKIFDETALDQGNLRIYYRSDREVEQFKDLDVQLILPTGEVQKVKSDNVFTEQINNNVASKKIFIPNLKKGSIIEYRYELESAYINSLYEPWYFQQDIPVKWSQITVTIPQYFTYVYLLQSPRVFDLKEAKQESVSAAFTTPYVATVSTYGLSNLPAIKKEAYITTLEDYQAHIGFQLSEIYFPGSAVEKVMSTWPELAKQMTEMEHCGAQYLKTGNFDNIWSAFRKAVPENTPKNELPDKVLHFVAANMKWNGENRRFTDANLDAAFSKKTGSSADLNLAVVALLRKLDFDAVPLFISTRDHGQMYNLYPFVNQFNSVVAFMYEGTGGIMLDATNPMQPLGQMRSECYNDQGWLVDEKRPNWVNIPAPELGETRFVSMKLDENGELSGHVSINLSGPAATIWRTDLKDEKEAAFLKAHFAETYEERSFDSIRISDREALDKPLKIDFHCRLPNAATVVNDFLYFKPVVDFYIAENPLKALKRTFPVNFTYPSKSQYVLNLEFPKGYVVEDLPQPARIILPKNGGKIQFSCGKTGENQLQVVLKMNISQLEFLPDEYDLLRQFFELMAEKVQFQLALKKV